jgi:FSR family fosmidomycin resistance protein-like MFS transporter
MNGKRLFAASYGHFSIDILNSSVPIILTAVATDFNLDVSQIGLAAMTYTFAASLTQPLFGFLVDKVRGRWIAGLGLVWTMFFYAAAPFMPNYPLLVFCLALGALGSGAFHPAGMVNATMAGGHKPTTATSLFFVGGQSGLAIGPWLSGYLIQRFGLSALPYMALAMLPAALYMLWFLRQPYEEVGHKPASRAEANANATPAQPTGNDRAAMQTGALVITTFILLITFRSTTQQGFSTLLPKYFADQGYTPAVYGLMLSVLGFAGATGTMLGGWLGDRYNRRMVIVISMGLGAIFSLSMLHTNGWLYAAAALGTGVMMNVPHSILIIMAQRLIPARKGMIGGAVLGMMFATGAAMTGVMSWIADYTGLPAVLNVIALLPMAAALCALTLPSTRGSEDHKPAPAAKAAAPAGD